MTYLWINPVSERMISAEALERMLEKHDLSGKLGRDRASEVPGAFGTCRWNFCRCKMSGCGISGAFPAA